mmetsp:Transcript_59344/g.193569  ORF Transcript_59344/g.193569 Transcript_59344/m.193569 type:complete len:229 (-) Transcript_59344:1496-2182(-)
MHGELEARLAPLAAGLHHVLHLVLGYIEFRADMEQLRQSVRSNMDATPDCLVAEQRGQLLAQIFVMVGTSPPSVEPWLLRPLELMKVLLVLLLRPLMLQWLLLLPKLRVLPLENLLLKCAHPDMIGQRWWGQTKRQVSSFALLACFSRDGFLRCACRFEEKPRRLGIAWGPLRLRGLMGLARGSKGRYRFAVCRRRQCWHNHRLRILQQFEGRPSNHSLWGRGPLRAR